MRTSEREGREDSAKGAKEQPKFRLDDRTRATGALSAGGAFGRDTQLGLDATMFR